MSRYINLPTLEIDFISPGDMTFDVVGNSVEGGRNGLGQTSSMEFSGGGMVTGSYDGCFIYDGEQHEYINWLAARLNGSHRFINVPLLTDRMGPFPLIGGKITPIIKGIPHSDGSLFSDGSGYSQATVWGKITADAAVNAGVVSMRVYGAARRLRWSDWFSIDHPVKGSRAYRYWDVRSVTEASESVEGMEMAVQDYSIAIAPSLRQAVASGTRVEFARPRCVMRFPASFTLAWKVQPPYHAPHGLQFTEAF